MGAHGLRGEKHTCWSRRAFHAGQGADSTEDKSSPQSAHAQIQTSEGERAAATRPLLGHPPSSRQIRATVHETQSPVRLTGLGRATGQLPSNERSGLS